MHSTHTHTHTNTHTYTHTHTHTRAHTHTYIHTHTHTCTCTHTHTYMIWGNAGPTSLRYRISLHGRTQPYKFLICGHRHRPNIHHALRSCLNWNLLGENTDLMLTTTHMHVNGPGYNYASVLAQLKVTHSDEGDFWRDFLMCREQLTHIYGMNIMGVVVILYVWYVLQMWFMCIVHIF